MEKPLNHKKRWTKEEELFLTENWGILTMKTLQKKLQRTEIAIQQRASDLNLGNAQYAGGAIYKPSTSGRDSKKRCKRDISLYRRRQTKSKI